jgi:antitoxin VapB
MGYKMPLYLKDPEVDRLVERLADREKITKTEVVRRSLQREWERLEGATTLVEKGVEFVRALHARSDRAGGQSVDKAFIDGLYDG